MKDILRKFLFNWLQRMYVKDSEEEIECMFEAKNEF